MARASFGARLEREFLSRRKKNSRYSLRAFAALLAADHSTLSQIMRGSRPAPATKIRAWGRKLGLGPEEAAAYAARPGSSEAGNFVDSRIHWELILLARSPEFRADCRWMSERIGASVDEVNMAITRLLRLGLLEGNAGATWRCAEDVQRIPEQEFRELALVRIRKIGAQEQLWVTA